jgi:hypothetical protein
MDVENCKKNKNGGFLCTNMLRSLGSAGRPDYDGPI